MYKLLALDLDGTLLTSDKRVDRRDIDAIAELQRAGVTVTIVTGRLHSGADEAARVCNIAGAIACVEGSHLVIVDTGQTLAHHAMPPAMTARLRDVFGANALASFVFDADAIHHDHSGVPFASYVKTWSPNLRVVDEALDEAVWARDPLAAVAIGEPDAVAAAMAALRPHAASLFSVSFEVSWIPGKHAVLVRAAGPNKGSALVELCAQAGCTVDEAVAVGDWVNDVPMFEVAGRSFAMGSTPDAVRSKASDVLESASGAGGGIAEAIRRAWG
jgi:Cof subfamily protein (haloacid dehalogenase superfamily)